MKEEEIKNEHEFKESLQVDVFYPDHTPRIESETFVKSRKHLIDELNTPCFICSMTLEEAKKQNTDLELHHYYVEWAYSDAVDWNGEIRDKHKDFDWSKFTKPEDFVDSEYNTMVLCQVHHRHKDKGIHMIPFPLWIVQNLFIKTFVDTPDQIVINLDNTTSV